LVYSFSEGLARRFIYDWLKTLLMVAGWLACLLVGWLARLLTSLLASSIACLLRSWLACLHAKLLLALAYLHGSQRDAEKYRIYKSISIYTIRTIPKIGWLQRALTTNNLELTNE
jgi:uncharacterized protein involved in cysteine biosynthesis